MKNSVLFRNRRVVPQHRQIGLARDVVEIAAIILAGIWAIYVFVYTDRIEPYQKPSAPIVDASIAVVGAKGSMLAVQLTQSIRNTAPATLFVRGTSAQISGITVHVSPEHALRTVRSTGTLQQDRIRSENLEEAYAWIYTKPMALGSGQDFVHRWIAYVPRGRYDSLIFDALWAYTHNPGENPSLRSSRNKAGIIEFGNTGGLQITASEISISLWPPQRR